MGYLTEHINWWNEKLTPNQITWDREYRDSLKWTEVSKMQNMTVDYIREFQNELDWNMLNRNTSIDEKVLEEFWDRIDWKDVLSRRYFSEEFIKKHKYDLDWKQISYFQKLSEDFVNEMEDYIIWDQFNPGKETWEGYSIEFKIKHFDQMKQWYKESGRFWGEEFELVEVNGEKKILKTKYSIKFGVTKEYL